MAERTIDVTNIDLAQLYGSFDSNIRLVESEMRVTVTSRGGVLKIVGEEGDAANAHRAIANLIEMLERGESLDEQRVRYTVSMAEDGLDAKALTPDCVCVNAKGKPIRTKTMGQRTYVQSLRDNVVVFGIGPAGTGKTYLAVAMAVNAFRNKDVGRIIITRPAVEAGENLGFLPGDLQMKVDPYLRPLHDAMYDMLGMENYNKYVEKGMIEVAPLAYMRGRTLDNSYIILDEAQNTTPEQMKMFLTRIGFGSKAIVTGDITQIDLPTGRKSGLKEAAKILRDIEGIDFCYLSEKDVVRHPLVQKIIKAYEKHDNAQNKPARPRS